MSSDQSVVLQTLLARWQRGEESARQELLQCAYERLRRLAAVILNESFPRLKTAPALLQTTDVANETALGMYQMLSELRPATVEDFFRLAAQRARWFLLDRAKQLARAQRLLDECPPTQEMPEDPHKDEPPPTLAALYRRIDELPENERAVVDLLYFHGLSQTEAAGGLRVTERTVRRHWTAARVRLLEGLQGLMPSGAGPPLAPSWGADQGP